MSSVESTRVWILGAGFSRSLGGPLLDELFTNAALTFVRAAFSGPEFGKFQAADLSGVNKLYSHGKKSGNWINPEDFIDKLESAATQPDSALNRYFKAIISASGNMFPEWDHDELISIYDAARRLFIAECCAFLQDADTSSERWLPYQRWASSLSSRDTIITFNYDRVLEVLIDTFTAKNSNLTVLMPNAPISPLAPPMARILKLHGSVDWRKVKGNGRATFSREDATFALKCPKEDIAIATPGARKITVTEEFGGLWRSAEASLSTAGQVNLLGYRFPQTDAMSKDRIIAGILNNFYQPLEINLILGPDTSSVDYNRVETLFRHGLRRSKEKTSINRIAAWCEDYLISPGC